MRFGCDDDIVNVNVGVAASNVKDKDVIHHVLEGGGGVVQPERHDFPFITPSGRSEGSLPFVSRLDPNVVVTGSNIQFGKAGTTLPLVDELWDEREGVRVFNRDGVEFSVITLGAKVDLPSRFGLS